MRLSVVTAVIAFHLVWYPRKDGVDAGFEQPWLEETAAPQRAAVLLQATNTETTTTEVHFSRKTSNPKNVYTEGKGGAAMFRHEPAWRE